MMLTRERALRVRNALDNWLPPAWRDSRLVMYPLLRAVFGSQYREFADFKQQGFTMSAAEFSGVYETTRDLQGIQGCTDLNEACTAEILRHVVGTSVLDAGCGRGYLVDRLSVVCADVVGCDIVLDEQLTERPGVRFQRGSVEDLPFDDDAFDTVVSTHTLEHVQHIDVALSELRRVARRRLVIVVPRERAYRYSFNLHLHFFPYPWSWQAVAGTPPRSSLADVGGDWFYVEELG